MPITLSYGAVTNSDSDMFHDQESGEIQKDIQQPSNRGNILVKLLISAAVISTICLGAITIPTINSRVYSTSLTDFREGKIGSSSSSMVVGGQSGVVGISSTTMGPPPTDVIPDGGKPPGKTVPQVTTVPIKYGKTFGLNRVGYSYISTDNDPLSYTKVKYHNAILEPHAPMSLWLATPDESAYYKYSLCDMAGKCFEGVYSSSSSATSSPVTIGCTPGDVYKLSYTSYNIETNEEVDSAKGSTICSYVRREIRSLTDDDLAKTMDAMHTMWVVNDSDGATKYGKNYMSASTFTNIHHFNAAWQDADHIHEGNGFLVQHLKMTNMFELSMQAVDPSVSLPYWDYTIDNALDRQAFNSYIMTADVFGGMNMPTDVTYGFGPSKDKIVNAGIPNGRWAGLKAEKTQKYADLKHSYGYVRAPWNMNPSPYISRYTSDYRIGINLPSCTTHYKMLQETDMMNFFYKSAYDSHATTHSLIGGIYGCELMKPLLEKGYINSDEDLKQICSKWVFNLKEFYRSDFIKPRTDCTVDENDVDSATCGFVCQDSSEDGVTLFKNNIKARLGTHIPSNIDQTGIDTWFDFVCTGDAYRIFAGDHLESASSADPSFWVIHPTLDRLLHAKIMSGGFDKSTWASDIMQDFVCEKSKCYEGDNGLKDKKTAQYAECCYGHYENDQLYDPIIGDRSNKFGPTNAEMVKLGNPKSSDYAMTYVYDSFAWSHCSDDFNGLLTS